MLVCACRRCHSSVLAVCPLFARAWVARVWACSDMPHIALRKDAFCVVKGALLRPGLASIANLLLTRCEPAIYAKPVSRVPVGCCWVPRGSANGGAFTVDGHYSRWWCLLFLPQGRRTPYVELTLIKKTTNGYDVTGRPKNFVFRLPLHTPFSIFADTWKQSEDKPKYLNDETTIYVHPVGGAVRGSMLPGPVARETRGEAPHLD